MEVPGRFILLGHLPDIMRLQSQVVKHYPFLRDISTGYIVSTMQIQILALHLPMASGFNIIAHIT